MQRLEGRLADVAVGGDAGDMVAHWQAEVTAADERARQAAGEHAKETSALRQAHARCFMFLVP